MSFDILTHTHTHIITQHGVPLSLFSIGVRGENRWRGWRGEREGGVTGDKGEKKKNERERKEESDGEMREGGGGRCIKIK